MTKFSKEFRLHLVKEVDQGLPINYVARKYGVGGIEFGHSTS